ncbi:uncharacterized protein VP01_9933g1, partial [Puccinia sorghi]
MYFNKLFSLAADRQALAADRCATQDRMTQFEQALLQLSMKPETPTPSPQENNQGADLQRFHLADSPIYDGSFHAAEPFLSSKSSRTQKITQRTPESGSEAQ